jgi:hypothetical protein
LAVQLELSTHVLISIDNAIMFIMMDGQHTQTLPSTLFPPPSPTTPAGSAVRDNSVHGAQLITLNATTADVAFYAATDANNPYATQVDCYRLIKQSSGGAISYSSCAGAAPPTPPGGQQYSLLTGAVADNAQGTANRVTWQ